MTYQEAQRAKVQARIDAQREREAACDHSEHRSSWSDSRGAFMCHGCGYLDYA